AGIEAGLHRHREHLHQPSGRFRGRGPPAHEDARGRRAEFLERHADRVRHDRLRHWLETDPAAVRTVCPFFDALALNRRKLAATEKCAERSRTPAARSRASGDKDVPAPRFLDAKVQYIAAMTQRPRYYANDHSRDVLSLDERVVRIENARLRAQQPTLEEEG